MLDRIIQITITLYSLLLCPLFFGLLCRQFCGRKQDSFRWIYATGYLFLFALFEVLSVPMLNKGYGIGQISTVWYGVTLGVTVLAVLLSLKDLLGILKGWGETLKKTFTCREERPWLLLYGVFAILMIASVFFLTASADDATVEILRTNFDTGTLYQFHPYSQTPYGGTALEKAYAPTELFYAVVIEKTGMDVFRFVEFVIPVFYLPLFFSVFRMLAEVLFTGAGEADLMYGKNGEIAKDDGVPSTKQVKNKERNKQFFLVAVLVFYTAIMFLQRDGAAQVFRNIWMDRTLLCNVAMPFLLYAVLTLLQSRAKKETASAIVLIIIAAFAAQYTFRYGLILSLVMIVPAVVLCLVRSIRGKKAGQGKSRDELSPNDLEKGGEVDDA